jgi:solute:Na+ symporter, SSS family
MHWIDWTILIGTLVFITAYGIYKSRDQKDVQSYLIGNRDLKWWTIGLSIMATQASAITFLSTTGQGYETGMKFIQFYLGLPIAMVILAVFFVPIFYKLNVITAYEFLEKRFDLRTRSFTSILFLLQRGMAAGLTIYAPAIVLSTILNLSLPVTILLLGVFVIVYTVIGGGEAVSKTQEQQMIIILSGMFLALFVMIKNLPQGVGVLDAVNIAGELGKVNLIDFKFDLSNRYNFWSGMLGGTFLFLSYFGTDQSQVQRYLGGKSLTESKLGLLFNGLIKVPMQFFILFVGIMMFVFFQFNHSPIHFNKTNISSLEKSIYKPNLDNLNKELYQVVEERKPLLTSMVTAINTKDLNKKNAIINDLKTINNKEKQLRDSVRSLILLADSKAEKKDQDYVFISYVIDHLPIGIIGLLIAVIFSAAMSSTSSELNALATCTVVDFYQRIFVTKKEEKHYMHASKWITLIWGVIALGFALTASLFENLIEAVNIIGSLFYGTILGIFMVAFFMKKIAGRAVFTAAVFTEIFVIVVFILDKLDIFKFAYLWLNLLGCILVMSLSILFQSIYKEDSKVVTGY